MPNQELERLSERWGVELRGFENLIIPLKKDEYTGIGKEANLVAKLLEKRGYRLRGLNFQYNEPYVVVFDNGTYGFTHNIPNDISKFKFRNIKDIKGEQIVDKNLFFGFVYGSVFGILITIFVIWLM